MKTQITPPILRRALALGLLTAFTPTLLNAATTYYWQGAEEAGWFATDGDGNYYWNTASDGTGTATALPTAGDTANIINDSTVNFSDSSANLTIATLTIRSSASTTSSTLNFSQGSLTTSSNINLGTTTGKGIINQTGGTVLVKGNMTFGANTSARQGFYNLSGQGSLTVNGTVSLGNAGNGFLTQTGGAAEFKGNFNITPGVNDANATASTTGSYSIAGGTVSFANLTNGAWGAGTQRGVGTAILEVIGSTASINVSGNYATGTQKTTNSTGAGVTGKRTSTLSIKIDNGGLARINLTDDTKTADLAGQLQAGIKGGVALTQSNSFTVLEAGTGMITADTDFTNSLSSSALWAAPSIQAVNGTRDGLVITYKASANHGNLVATSDGSIAGTTFTAASAGFVSLTGLEAGDSVSVYLNAAAGTGKTIGDLTAWLSGNGIVATTTDEAGYNILLSMTSTAATGFFAWDLSEFNATAALSAIGISATGAIPEPATVAVLLGLGTIAFVALRRKRSAA